MRKNYLLVLAAFLSWQAFGQGETCANPISIGSLPYSTTDNTSNYGDDYSAADCDDDYISGDDVVYAFTPATNMTVNVSLTDLDDTYAGLYVLDGCLDATHTCLDFVGNGSSTGNMSVQVDLISGTTYYIVISTYTTPQSVGYTLSLEEILPCGTYSVPFTETFNSLSPSQYCWTVLDENADANGWDMDDDSYTFEGDESASLYTDYNDGDNDDWLISPAITLTGNERLRYYSSVESSGEPNDYEIRLSTTGNAPADFTNVITPLAAYSNEAYEERIEDLSAFTGDVYIAFRVPPGGLDGWVLYLDEVIVEAIPSCLEPISLGAVDAVSGGITLVWEEQASATEWQYQFGAEGFTLGSGTSAIVADTFDILSGQADGLYDFYVRSICAPGDTSTWVGPFTYNIGYCTPSSDQTVTYIDNFSTSVGTVNISNLASGYTAGGYQNNASTMSVSVPASENINWDLELVGGTVGVSIWIDWNNDLTFDLSEREFNTTSYTDGPLNGSIPVDIATVPGDYRMRVLIHWNDPEPDDACASNPRLEAEDYTVTVLAAPTCLIPSALGTQNVGSDDAELFWTESNSAAEWQIVYGTEGFAIASGTAEITGDNPVLVDNLTSNTDYEFYVRSICAAGDTSNYAGPFAFSTLPDYCGADNFTDNGGVTDTYQFNNDDITTVICPEVPGDVVQVEFLSFEVEGAGADDCYDWLYIYDGQDDSGTPITPLSLGLGASEDGFCYETAGDGTADLTGQIIVADNASGCLTFNFTSDGSGLYDGWEAVVSCFTPTVDVTPNAADADTVFCNEMNISPTFWVVNNGTVTATDATYSITLGGVEVADGTVTVPAGDSVEVTIGPFPTAPGVHDVEITTTHGDDIDNANDAVSLTIYISHTTATASITSEISCFGESAEAQAAGSNGIGQYTFEWDAAAGGVTTATVTDLGPGSYWVYVSDSILCMDSAEVVIIEPAELIATAVDNLDQTGTASATGGTTPYTYEWDNGDLTETSAGMGDRYCIITDANGCVDTAFIEITVSVDELSLEMLHVYPNPSEGLVYVDLSAASYTSADIVVTDNTGKIVLEQPAFDGTQLVELNLSNVETGIYFVKLTVDGSAITKRIVIQNK